METKENLSITDKVMNGLKKAVVEMEELRVQAALGKAEAHDLYEESKKKFDLYIHNAKHDLINLKSKTKTEVLTVRSFLESLQVQLALGKAETKELFEEQRKKIFKALHELEVLIKNNETTNEYYTTLLMEIEKFKIKLEILKLQYELKKLNAKEAFEEKKVEFLSKLDEIKNRMLDKSKEHSSRWEFFQKEIGEAYSHLKHAFVQ